MVLESLENSLFLIITIVAGLVAISGVVVLEGLFRNRLKNLFDDSSYFVFFFIVAGYLLYALGEVSFYLTRKTFEDVTAVGIQDIYWSGGAILIFVSFIALSLILYRTHGGLGKLLIQAIIGSALVILAIAITFSATSAEGYTFGYFYPIISALIVAASSSVILFSRQLKAMESPLVIFFIASIGIFFGDLFFTFSTAQLSYGLTQVISDFFYLLGYGLSGAGFIVLRRSMHRLSSASGSKV